MSRITFVDVFRTSAWMLLVSAISVNGMAAAADDTAWTISPREVPLPGAASAELRESIAAGGAPAIGPRQAVVEMSDEQWVAWIAQRDAQRAAPIATREAAFGVSIEKDTIAGVAIYRVTPNSIAPENANRLFLHLHGGGYALNGGDNAVAEAAVIAGRAGIPAISVDYRMPPAHPYPAAVNDVLAVYKHLLVERSAKSIAIGGTSAGGGLTLAAIQRILADGLEAPGAAYGGTPWADLTNTSDTLHTNAGIDRVLVDYEPMLSALAKLYAGEFALTDPGISPVYGSFEGFPPTYLLSGTRDMLLSDTVRVHRKLRQAGVIADLHVYEAMSHADYLFVVDAPESHEAIAELGAFFAAHLE